MESNNSDSDTQNESLKFSDDSDEDLDGSFDAEYYPENINFGFMLPKFEKKKCVAYYFTKSCQNTISPCINVVSQKKKQVLAILLYRIKKTKEVLVSDI